MKLYIGNICFVSSTNELKLICWNTFLLSLHFIWLVVLSPSKLYGLICAFCFMTRWFVQIFLVQSRGIVTFSICLFSSISISLYLFPVIWLSDVWGVLCAHDFGATKSSETTKIANTISTLTSAASNHTQSF